MSGFDFETRVITVSVFGRSDVGRRRSDNQDDFVIADLSSSDGQGCLLRPEDSTDGRMGSGEIVLGRKGALVLVADGMGGAAGGLASRLATTWILDELRASWATERDPTPRRFAQLLQLAIQRTNARIHEQAMRSPELNGMGTTATAVGILDDYIYVAQVGDSRAYLLREGHASQLTRDQSMVQALIDAGTLTEEEAETSGHRSVILQALGTAPEVNVEMTYQELRRGDLLILCSDGLSRVVRRNEIEAVADGSDDLVAVCNELVAMANERGGPDNVTVVLARVDGSGLEHATAGEPVTRNVFVVPEP